MRRYWGWHRVQEGKRARHGCNLCDLFYPSWRIATGKTDYLRGAPNSCFQTAGRFSYHR